MNLKETNVILASGSPRRIDMLRADGVEPLIVKPDCEEKIHIALSPAQEVMALALRKNLRAVEMLKEQGDLPAEGVVLSADTMVVLDGVPMGKPRDEEDAFRDFDPEMRFEEEEEELIDEEPLALFPEEVAPYKERKTRAQRFAERAARAANRKAKAAERKLIKQEKAARKRGIAPEDFVQPGYEPTIDPDLL